MRPDRRGGFRGARWFSRALTAGLVAGLLARWGLRDHVAVMAMLYYMARPEVLAAGALVLALLLARRRMPRAALIAGGVSAACAADAFWSDFRRSGASGALQRDLRGAASATQAAALELGSGSAAIRIALWNVSSGWGGWPAMAQTVADERPDVVGLVEAWRSGVDRTCLLRTSPHLVEITDDTYGLVVGVRGRIESCESRVFERRGRLKLVRAALGERPVTILLVDIPGDPLVFRKPYLADLAAIVAAIDGPVILLGDFNTPPDSVHFAPLRRELGSAFEQAGRGYACTWPSPLPVLALDQIWLSPDFVPLACETRATLRSDHWLVRTDAQLGR
ncbi:MAG: hypothetical protein CHACPFDD_03499 [Phycisphaerae bacterium]|nr:hypothetical protein [Phycisphaerae bacterium]